MVEPYRIAAGYLLVKETSACITPWAAQDRDPLLFWRVVSAVLAAFLPATLAATLAP